MNTKFNFTHNGTEYFYVEGYFDSAISEDELSGELVFTDIEIVGEVNAESFKISTIEALTPSLKAAYVPTRQEVEFGNEVMEF